MRALLDVNVLIALLDLAHMHNAAATQWLRDNLDHGWASCPLTQAGCISILTQRAYPASEPATPLDVAERLAEAAAQPMHEFWPDDASLVAPGALNWRKLLSGRHLTDAYLLMLAVSRRARLVTFDQGIPLEVVPGARSENLCVIQHLAH